MNGKCNYSTSGSSNNDQETPKLPWYLNRDYD